VRARATAMRNKRERLAAMAPAYPRAYNGGERF